EQLFCQHPFQEIAAGAGLQSAIYVFVTVIGGQDNNPRCRELLSNSDDCIDATQQRHSQIHNRDIGAVLLEQVYSLLAIDGFGDDRHIALGIDQGGESAPDNIMIISNKQLDLIWRIVHQRFEYLVVPEGGFPLMTGTDGDQQELISAKIRRIWAAVKPNELAKESVIRPSIRGLASNRHL